MADVQASSKMHRIGWLGSGSANASSPAFEAFRQGMRDLGYVEGATIVIEPRWWNGRDEEMPALVASLLGSKPDIIVAQGPAVTHGARHITEVPVVFSVSADPVSAGLARSLARPGGNLTGRTLMSLEINGKRLELLREALPRIARVALLSNTTHPGDALEMSENVASARRLGLSIHHVHAQTAAEIEAALTKLKSIRPEAIVVLPDSLLMQNRARIIAFANRNGIPLMSGWAAYAHSGGLMTYGPNLMTSHRQLAGYVDRILKGARPAELPIDRPTEFELVVNLKTAKTLGITIPESILLRADEVIE